MSLAEVVSALNAAISGGTIDLYAASDDPALEPLGPLLTRLTIVSSFVLTGARLTPAATSATLTGSGHWGPAGAPPANVVPISARLDCTATGSAPVLFTLSLAPSTPGWTFATSFAVLPES